MTLLKSTLALTIALITTSAAVAQNGNAVAQVPINNWSYQRHASTAEEGFLRGSASVIQATGQKNYLDSLAYVNFHEGNRRRIENGSLWVRKYLENKELNRQYREKYAPVPPTKEQWDRITQASLPPRLTAEQFDPATGALVWPHILRGDQYKVLRDRINDLVSSRTPDNSGDGSLAQRELAQLIDGMLLLLKDNVHNVTTSQYGAAKTFLLSLDYEAQMPMTNPVVANLQTPAQVN